LEPQPPDPASAPPAAHAPGGAAFALLLAALLPAGIAAQVAQPLAGLLWTELFVFLLPAVIVAAGSGLDARSWLRLRAAPRRALAAAVPVGLAGWLLGSAAFAAVRALAPASLVERYDLSRLFEGPATEQAGFALAAAIVAPLCEEVAFRGHLASALHARHRPAAAIAVSALLFGLLHLDPLRAPSLVLLGAIYGWLAWRTGSIWPAVIAHATNNGLAAGLALWVGGDATEPSEPTLAMALAGMAFGAVAVLAASALFRAASRPPPLPGSPCPGAPTPQPFRLAGVPRSLLLVAAAGWAALAAILLGAG
jgi:membrane protease YdiL (CAAX protease family)